MANLDFNPNTGEQPPDQQQRQRDWFPQPPQSPLTQLASTAQPIKRVDPNTYFQQNPPPEDQQQPPQAKPVQTEREEPKPTEPDEQPPKPVQSNLQRPYPFQQFRPNQPRDEKWGQDHWARRAGEDYPAIGGSPYMPSYEESFGVIGGAGRQLGAFGPPAVAQPATFASSIANKIGRFADFLGGGAFGRNYDAATARRVALRREEMELDREQMIQYGEQAIREHKRILANYEEVFAAKRNNPNMTVREAQDRLWTLAAQNNDRVLQEVIANGGLQAAENFIKSMDAKFMDFWSGITMQQSHSKRSTTKDDQKADSWLKDGGRSGAHPGITPLEPGGVKPEGEETPSEEAPGEMSDNDKRVMERYELSPEGMRAAKDIVATGKPLGMTDAGARLTHKEGFDKVQSAASDMNGQIDAFANNPSLSTDQKMAGIRAINPNLARQVDGLRDYSNDPKSKDQQRAVNLAEAVSNGQYHASNYKIITDLKDSSKQSGKIINRVNLEASGMQQLVDAVKDLNLGDPIPKQQIEMLLADHWNGDNKYGKIYSALRNMSTEVSAVTGQGSVRVTLVDKLLKEAHPYSSAAQILGQMQIEMSSALQQMNTVERDWKRLGGVGPAPLIDPTIKNIFRSYLHMNPWTGEVPSDAPTEVLATGRKGGPGPGVPKNEGWSPIPLGARKSIIDKVNQLRQSNDPEIQQQVRDALHALGDIEIGEPLY